MNLIFYKGCIFRYAKSKIGGKWKCKGKNKRVLLEKVVNKEYYFPLEKAEITFPLF